MKKRRELDALVGGGKSRRKSSNSGSGHELLRYNASESSDEDFRLTPPKVRGTGLCSTCASIFVFLLLVACMLVCAGLAWMHVEMKKDLEILRLSVEAVEGRSTANTDDVERLFQQMAAVNKSVDQHSKMLDRVISNMSTINNTVWKLSLKVDKLSEGLKAAPELKQLPDKLQTVSQSLATLGSDVSGMKDVVDDVSPFMKSTNEKLNDLTSQLQVINDQLSGEKSSSDSGSVKPELENVIEGLSQKIQDVNSTVATQISVLTRSNSQYENRLTHLENATRVLKTNLSTMASDHTSIASEHASLTDDYTSETFKSSVSDIVQDLLINEGPVPSGVDVQTLMVNITQALDSLKQMEDNYKHMEQKSELEPVPDDEYVSLDMFQTLGDEFEAKVENLNTTFMNLKSDVSTMSHILTLHSNTLTNLTHQVDGTRNYLATLQRKFEHAVGSTNSQTQPPKTTEKMKLETGNSASEKATEKVIIEMTTEKLTTPKVIAGRPATTPTATKPVEETQQPEAQTAPTTTERTTTKSTQPPR